MPQLNQGGGVVALGTRGWGGCGGWEGSFGKQPPGGNGGGHKRKALECEGPERNRRMKII